MTITIVEVPKEGFEAVKQYKQQPVYFFRFDGEETENDTIVCSETTITLHGAKYDTMVSALIATKYSEDAQIALLFNYQNDAEQYAEQMMEYQAWRMYCKESARAFFGREQ